MAVLEGKELMKYSVICVSRFFHDIYSSVCLVCFCHDVFRDESLKKSANPREKNSQEIEQHIYDRADSRVHNIHMLLI